MIFINNDVLWLEPLVLDINNVEIETTFGYQIASLHLFNMSFSSSSSSTAMSAIVSQQNHFVILKWSVRIIGGILIIVGGIGNTLSALTLSRKKLRAQVTSIYLIALALSDLGKKNNKPQQIESFRVLIRHLLFSRQCFLQCSQFLSHPS